MTTIEANREARAHPIRPPALNRRTALRRRTVPLGVVRRSDPTGFIQGEFAPKGRSRSGWCGQNRRTVFTVLSPHGRR